MVTVVNNPPPNDSGGMGFFAGIVLLIIFVFAIWYWGLPAIRNMRTQQGSPVQITVPDSIDVNVKQVQ